MELLPGLKGTAQSLVRRADTAKEMGSGALLVYATPAVVALMEQAACNALVDALPEEQTSVGTAMTLAHTSATPVGMEVSAEATLTAVDGLRLTFEITAQDEKGEIAKATHERFIVNVEHFLQKAYDKL